MPWLIGIGLLLIVGGEFDGVTNDTQGGFHVFANVQAASQGWSQRPSRPLISGVDRGLAQ